MTKVKVGWDQFLDRMASESCSRDSPKESNCTFDNLIDTDKTRS